MTTLTFQASGKVTEGRFTAAPHHRVAVEVKRDGVVADRFTVDASKPRSRLPVTRLGATDADVIRLCDEAERTGQPVVWLVPEEEPPPPPGHLRLTIREMDAAGGTVVDGLGEPLLRDHLAATPVTRLLCWTDRASMLCLDIGYHNTSPPPRQHLEAWVEALRPRPVAWHYSKGGGAHLFYVATGRFTAEELAAAAALRFRTVDPSAGLDLVVQVRGAGDETIRWNQASADGAGTWVPGGTLEPGDSTVTDWLTENGMTMHGRYDHAKCPIDPGGDAQREPVVVMDIGVFCFRCAARGLSLGSRKPGMAAYSALTCTQGGSDLGRLVRNRVHWGHARWTLIEKYELPESLARLGYAAALKATHEDMQDDELAAVFCAETNDLARSNDAWQNLTSSYFYPTNSVAPLLQTLPACLIRDDRNRLRPAPSKVAYMLQGHDLSHRGYDNIKVVRGYRLTRQFIPQIETQVGMLAKELRGNPRAPRYIRRGARRPVEWAEGVFERLFPGVSWQAIRTQICAAGVAQELRLGLHPLLFVAGPSGAAKTATVKLAAGILGTGATDVSYHADEEKLRRAIAAAGSMSAFALCNEFIKDYRRLKRTADPLGAMETFLSLTPETLNHVMFVGPRTVGKLPAVVITEPRLPLVVSRNYQLARRFRLIQLYGEKKQWGQTFASLNLPPDALHLYRLRDAELAEAADTILSDLIDAYFATPTNDWEAMANSLGVPTIAANPDFEDPNAIRGEFYRLVCAAPDITEPRLVKRLGPGTGWKHIHRGDADSELVEAWSNICDGKEGRWFTSEVLSEGDWNAIIETDHPVRLDIQDDKANSVFVRFRVGPSKKPMYLNEGIPKREGAK